MSTSEVEETTTPASAAPMPFGAVYFGALLIVAGVVAAVAGLPIGMLAAGAGVLFVCTGMLQRTLHRLLQ